MTHSLHRTGSAESLKDDFVIIVRPAVGVNSQGAAPRVQRALEIIFDVGPANIGILETGHTMLGGLDIPHVISRMDDTSGIRCAFSSGEKLKEVLRRLKQEELGLCVTVSGIIGDVFEMCDEVGLEPHSINVSLGVHGNTELLASEQVREFTTMCGHALIASSLARKAIEEVRCGKKSPREAAAMAAEPCACGLFNLDRAEAILSALQ
jgi:hypothetical protein